MNDVMSRLDLIGKTFFSKWEDFLPNNTLVIQHQNNSIILNIDFSICLDFNHTVLTYYIVNLLKKPIYLWQYTTSISAANSAATQLYGVGQIYNVWRNNCTPNDCRVWDTLRNAVWRSQWRPKVCTHEKSGLFLAFKAFVRHAIAIVTFLGSVPTCHSAAIHGPGVGNKIKGFVFFLHYFIYLGPKHL